MQDTPSSSPVQARTWGVVVVHGVGDTAPRKYLDAAIESFVKAFPGFTADEAAEHREVPISTSPDTTERFPLFTRKVTSATDKVLIAEVHWADITRVGPELLNVALSVLQFALGLRHIAFQAALIPGKCGAVLAGLLRLAVFLMLGPMLAMLLFEGALYSAVICFPSGWDKSGAVPAFIVLIMFAFCACGIGAWRLHKRAFVLWPSLLVVGSLVLVHLAVRWCGAGDDFYMLSVIPELNCPSGALPGEWALVGMMIDYALDWLLPVVGILFLAAGALVVATHCKVEPRVRRSMRTAWLATTLLFLMLNVVLRPIEVIAQVAYDKIWDDIDPRHIDTEKFKWHGKYTVWYDEFIIVCVGMLAAVWMTLLLVAHVRWARRAQRLTDRPSSELGVEVAVDLKSHAQRHPAPRLVLAFPLRLCLLAFALLYCPFAIFDSLSVIDRLGLEPQRMGSIPYGWAAIAYGVIGFVLLGSSVVVRHVLHILHDIVVHFETLAADRPFACRPGAAHRYVTRRKIAKRLRRVVEFVLEGGVENLVVVAHSQGTIIAVDEFVNPRWRKKLSGVRRTWLVTMGSPMSHIYQHYFPVLYGSVVEGRLGRLRQHFRGWINAFRVNDYVGTAIESSDPTWPVNVALPPVLPLGGHTNYWREDVCRKVWDTICADSRTNECTSSSEHDAASGHS